ncbi:MAG: ABC transporter permease subunit [Bdellovibrionales bacterium]|nr:ABC transporter permease subunit [Bdellovibrionales bacterium]
MAPANRTASRGLPRHVREKAQNSAMYFVLFLGLLAATIGLYRGGIHLVQLKAEELTLRDLPGALTLSLIRVLVSYSASLVFAFLLGLTAARSKLGERIILPLLDTLQSVPQVGFFPAAISFFIGATSGHRLGIELASVFLIFTSQAWNLAFAVYEATKTIPQDNYDAIESFGVKGSQKFWRLYAPACVPRLVYNSILSWSNGWYFLVACEIIAVGLIQYNLPGIGSFLSRAAETNKIDLLGWGLASLTALILAFDFLFWRPLSIWAERFRQETAYSSADSGAHRSPEWVHELTFKLKPVASALRRMLRALLFPLTWMTREILLPLFWDLPAAIIAWTGEALYRNLALPSYEKYEQLIAKAKWVRTVLLSALGAILGLAAALVLVRWLSPPWPSITREIPLAVLYSTLRLILALVISIAGTIPIVLICWDKPRIRQLFTTIAQVGASLPAVALFPLIVLVAVRKVGGGMESASIALLLTGMFWYPLFNCLGGVATIPHDLIEAMRALGLTRVQMWKRLVFPAMAPALVTGAITAWGGGWNALVVSEYVKLQGQVLQVRGLGSLLDRAVYELGNHQAITLCIAAMVGWILLLNAFFWKPIYRSTVDRYKLEA